MLNEVMIFLRFYSLGFVIYKMFLALWVLYFTLFSIPYIYIAFLCCTWVLLHSFIPHKNFLISCALIENLYLLLLCIFSLVYFLCRFLSKKVSKLIYTKFKYMFYTVNTCSHFSEFNITVASYFLSGLEKYDSMLSWF